MASENKIINDWSNGDTDGKNWLGQFNIEDNSLTIKSYNPTNTNQPLSDTIIALYRNGIISLEPNDPRPVSIEKGPRPNWNQVDMTSDFAVDNEKKEIYWAESGRIDNGVTKIWSKVYRSDLNIDNQEIIFEFDEPEDQPGWHVILVQAFSPGVVLDRRRNFLYAIVSVGVIVKIDVGTNSGYTSEIAIKSVSPDDVGSPTFDFMDGLQAKVNIAVVPGVTDQDTDMTGQGRIWPINFSTLRLDEENNGLYISGSLINNGDSVNLFVDLDSLELDSPQWVANTTSSSRTLSIVDTTRNLRYDRMSANWPELAPSNSSSDRPGITIARNYLDIVDWSDWFVEAESYQPNGFLSYDEFAALTFQERIQYTSTTIIYPNLPNYFIIDLIGRSSSLVSDIFLLDGYKRFIVNTLFLKNEMALWPNTQQKELFATVFGMVDYDDKIDSILCTTLDRRSIYSFDISNRIFINNFPHLPNFGTDVFIGSQIKRFNFNSNYVSKILFRKGSNDSPYFPDNPDDIGFTNDKIYVAIDIKEITDGSGYFEIYNGPEIVQNRTQILAGLTIVELQLDEDVNRINFVVGVTANIGKTGTIKLNSINFYFDEEPEIEPQPGCSQDLNQTSRIIARSDWSQGQTSLILTTPNSSPSQPAWYSQNTDFYQNALRLSSTNDGDGTLVKKDSIYTVGSGVILESSILLPRTVNHILDIGNGLDIAVDRINGYIYWTEISDSSPSSVGHRDGIYRCNADGTGFVEVLELTPEIRPYGIQLYNNHIYYTSDSANKIMRCNIDGSGLIELCTTTLRPKKFIIEESDDRIVYVASNDDIMSLLDIGGIFSCPINGGPEAIIAQSSQATQFNNYPFLRKVRAISPVPNPSGLNNSERYLLASDRNLARTTIVQQGGSGNNEIHRIVITDISLLLNNNLPILITFYNHINGDFSTLSFNSTNGSTALFSDINSNTDDLKNLIINSVYWIADNDIEVTRGFINEIFIEFKGALSNIRIQKTDALMRGAPDNDIYYINKFGINPLITQATEIRNDLRMFRSNDLTFDQATSEVLIAGNGVNLISGAYANSAIFPIDVYRERSIRDGKIRDGGVEGVDYGVTGPPAYISYMFLSDNSVPPHLREIFDFRLGQIFGVSIDVKDINNCRLFAQSISDTRAPLNPQNHSVFPTIFEEFELIVGMNDINFVVSQPGLLNIRIIIKSDNEGYHSAEIVNVTVCKPQRREELSCHGQSIVFDHDFELNRNGWSGGTLDTNKSSIVNTITDDGDDEFVTINRQLTVNRQPFGNYILGIKLGDIINFPDDPGFHITQDIFIEITKSDNTLWFNSAIFSIYGYQTWSSLDDALTLISLTTGTYNISIRIPLKSRYYFQNGVASQNIPVGQHEVRYFRRRIEIDQVLLCLASPNFRIPITVNHSSDFITFLPEAPKYFHYTDSRFVYFGRRHSTDFLSFDPGYVIASGNYTIQSHNIIGNTDVERFKEQLDPNCINSTKLNNHQWHTNKIPNNCGSHNRKIDSVEPENQQQGFPYTFDSPLS